MKITIAKIITLILVSASVFVIGQTKPAYAQQFDYEQDLAEDDQRHDQYERNYVSDKDDNIFSKIIIWLMLPAFALLGWVCWQMVKYSK